MTMDTTDTTTGDRQTGIRVAIVVAIAVALVGLSGAIGSMTAQTVLSSSGTDGIGQNGGGAR